MNRNKELPYNFLPAKQAIQKLENTYWYNKLNTKQEHDESKENLSLLYVMEEELVQFTQNKQYAIGEKLLSLLGSEESWTVLLGVYGKKVVYDVESRWIDIKDMEEKDYKNYDEKSNKEYLDGKESSR